MHKMKMFLIAAMFTMTAAASAQEIETRVLPNGNTEIRIPKFEERCVNKEEMTNVGNAALGAAAGYAGTKVVNTGRNSNRWAMGMALAGGLIGSQVDKDTKRVCENVHTGWEVRTGRGSTFVTTFVAK